MAKLVVALAVVAAGGVQAFTHVPSSAMTFRSRQAIAAASLPRLPGPRDWVVSESPPTLRHAHHKSAASALGVRAMAGDIVDNVAVVLLAGGVGSRMKAGKPKQFLELEGKTILRTSLDIFLAIEGVTSISVVLAEEYRDQLADIAASDSRVLSE